MTRRGSTCAVLFAAALAAGPHAANAATQLEQQVNEFWPELNATVKLGEQSRLFMLASLTRSRDTATSTEATYGIHYDWFAERLPERWVNALPRIEQNWHLWFRFGYQRIEVVGDEGDDENRLLADATMSSAPLFWGLQVSNRSRLEYRDVGSDDSWRYRNRTRVERSFATTAALGQRLGRPVEALGVRSLTPYAMIEFFWDSRVSDWSRRYQQYGLEFELRHDRSLEVYVAIQDDDRASRPTVIAVGAVLVFRY
jgi:hypothetical protein